jgi:hypothetical protein
MMVKRKRKKNEEERERERICDSFIRERPKSNTLRGKGRGHASLIG